jgi:hypothetical protein
MPLQYQTSMGSSVRRPGFQLARPGLAAALHHYRVGMTTPAMEQRILEPMPEDAKVALLLLARQSPYEVGRALDRIEGRKF